MGDNANLRNADYGHKLRNDHWLWEHGPLVVAVADIGRPPTTVILRLHNVCALAGKRLDISKLQKTAAIMRVRWLAYSVTVMLLAGWPWNAWLIALGAAYAQSLHRRSARDLLAAYYGKPSINGPQGIHHIVVVGDQPNAPQEHLRIARHQHFRDTLRDARIDAAAAGNQSARHSSRTHLGRVHVVSAVGAQRSGAASKA
jgi:hypothetical protein